MSEQGSPYVCTCKKNPGNTNIYKLLRLAIPHLLKYPSGIRPKMMLPAEKVALKYKEPWQVERVFRNVKTMLHIRPVCRQRDADIRDRVFCSFPALALRKKSERRLNASGYTFEWSDIRQDPKALRQAAMEENGRRPAARSRCQGVFGKIFQTVGVAMPPTIKEI